MKNNFDQNNTLQVDLKQSEEEVNSYAEQWIDPDNLVTIDCGIGEIKYLEPDNLKLRMLMEQFKEKQEYVANFK